MVLFLMAALTGAFGALTGWIWGHLVVTLQDGGSPVPLTAALVASLLVSPLLLAEAFRSYPRWWIAVMLRVRSAVLAGQTAQHRLERTPPGEVVARTMDADRLARYADRWVDFINGLAIAGVTALVAQSWLAGGVLLAVMVASALASSLGRRVAGRSAAASAAARARFGRSLVSALDSVRTVKLAASTPSVHAHLRDVDSGRVDAAVREHRVQALLDGVPIVMVQCGVVAAWGMLLTGGWGLATALLVAGAVNGFDWFGRVAGSVITEAPGTRAWMQHDQQARRRRRPDGAAPGRRPGARHRARTHARRAGPAAARSSSSGSPRSTTTARSASATSTSTIAHGELVLLLGQVGSGKSSLLGALAGLVASTGEVRWNGAARRGPPAVPAPRPGGARRAGAARASRARSPPTCSSTTPTGRSSRRWRRRGWRPTSSAAGGPDSLVGHRGVRLSGGQVQRLALARALACDAELLLADDVSSALDAATEIELWTRAARPGGHRRSGRPPSARRWRRPTGSWCWSRAGSPTSGRGTSSRRAGVTWRAEGRAERLAEGPADAPGGPPPPATPPPPAPARRCATRARRGAGRAGRRARRRPPAQAGR